MTTRVVNISRGADFDVFIGRGRNAILGNPFKIGIDGNRKQVIELFRSYFYKRIATDSVFKAKVLSLKDKILGCYCKSLACHGDIYVEYLDG